MFKTRLLQIPTLFTLSLALACSVLPAAGPKGGGGGHSGGGGGGHAGGGGGGVHVGGGGAHAGGFGAGGYHPSAGRMTGGMHGIGTPHGVSRSPAYHPAGVPYHQPIPRTVHVAPKVGIGVGIGVNSPYYRGGYYNHPTLGYGIGYRGYWHAPPPYYYSYLFGVPYITTYNYSPVYYAYNYGQNYGNGELASQLIEADRLTGNEFGGKVLTGEEYLAAAQAAFEAEDYPTAIKQASHAAIEMNEVVIIAGRIGRPGAADALFAM